MARIHKLTQEQQPAWGVMTAGNRLCVALGDTQAKDRGNAVKKPLVKWLIIYLPISAPKGKIKTVPEMLQTEPADWQADCAKFEALVHGWPRQRRLHRIPSLDQ